MSCDGTMHGSPFDGSSTLFDASISVRASICASSDSGTCTAIWSPSKSALNAVQTSGCSWIALPSISTGSNAWMPRRCSVGARFSSTGCSRITSSRMSQTTGSCALDHLLRGLDRGGEAHRLELVEDERLEELERHQLRQAALVQLELRTDDDDRAARVVDALAEQVLAEAAALALDHVGERLQRTLVRAGHRLAAAAVVEQRVDGFLQHPLLVAHDDVGRLELEQPLQPVVAVDHAAIQVVQVGGREAAAVQRHQRTQLRRQHRQHFEDHPLGLDARLVERLEHLQALGDLLDLGVRAGRLELLAELVDLVVDVERLQELADALGAHRRREVVAVLLELREVVVLGQELARG